MKHFVLQRSDRRVEESPCHVCLLDDHTSSISVYPLRREDSLQLLVFRLTYSAPLIERFPTSKLNSLHYALDRRMCADEFSVTYTPDIWPGGPM